MAKNIPSPDQPNGRERLLEAAVKLFGRDGFDGTSVRAVADEAGVSWGLVRFYFQSKDGLRDAAEDFVMRGYLQRVRAGSTVGSAEELEAIIESQTAGLSASVPFLRRAIMEERPIAIEFLRQLISTTEALRENSPDEYPDEPALWDPVRVVINRLGYLLLAPQIQTILGRDLFSVTELKRRNAQEVRIAELIERGLAVEREGRG